MLYICAMNESPDKWEGLSKEQLTAPRPIIPLSFKPAKREPQTAQFMDDAARNYDKFLKAIKE